SKSACSAARRSLPTSTSTTAAWNDAATSATSASGLRRQYVTTAVFSPENEKSSPSVAIGRGNGIASGSPRSDSASIAGPPGYPSPRNRATLSNASPAASSTV